MNHNPNDTIPIPPRELVEKKRPDRDYALEAKKTSPGIPGVILSPAAVRIRRAKLNAIHSTKRLVLPPKTDPDTIRRVKQGPGAWYIEWWKLGTKDTDINCATFETINIKHFLKVFKKHNHLSLLFLKRECDQKILFDRR